MDGISFKLEISGLDAALARLRATGSLDFYKLLDGLSRQGMDQTRQRLQHEKTSPEGVAWKKTLDGRGALFVTGKHLANQIDHAVSGDAAIWGVGGFAGARIHQFGGVIKPVNGSALKFWWQNEGFVHFAVVRSVTMPARPYLGVSQQNAREFEETALAYVAGRLNGRIS